MRRINYLTIMLAMALSMPVFNATAQYTGYRGGSTTTTGNPGGRRPDNNNQSNNNRPSQPNNNRPSNPGNNKPSNPGNNRPSNPGNNKPSNPGNNWNNRHDNGHHNQPGNPGWGVRPGNPGASVRPGNPGATQRPGNHGFRPSPPPSRPYRPTFTPYHCPVPPTSFRPYSSAPILSSILGLAFGTSINISINSLQRSGYYIDGYSNNEVYLRNVYEMNYSWEDGVVIYSGGGMQSARLYQSTYGYDTSRYDNLYSTLCAQYGLPATTNYSNGNREATWYDRNGTHYVSLAYDYMTSDGGYPRYYTILSYGY